MSTSTQDIAKLLGSVFFIGFDGYELSPAIQKFIQKNNIGGVTLFANNYQSPGQIAELCNQIQSLKTDLPLAIAVDYEGGRVQRFKKPFTKIPSALAVGNLDSPKLTYELAELIAKELTTVGVNIIFAPVADINTNPKNPVIGDRAYGADEEIVTKMVSAMVRGLVTHKLAPVVKHFPGHGDTALDSHFHLPKVTTSLETLQQRELKPFAKAFRSHCELVMMAHVIIEALDPKLPATLSEKAIGLLRNEMRYRGLIFSDDMEMKAITDHFGEVAAPLQALTAGVNLLLYHTEPFVNRVFDPLVAALAETKNAQALANLKISSQMFAEFKQKHFIPYQPVQITEIASIIGSEPHLDLVAKFSSNNTEVS